MSRCRSCNADLLWIRLKTGKAMPCDPYRRSIRTGEGTAVIITDEGKVLRGTFASLEDGANATGYESHFSTCPYAGRFRKR